MQPAELEPLRLWLLQSTGLQAELLGRQSLERAVTSRLRERKVESAQAYHQLLLQDSAEQQRLIEALVVGESWFLREPRSFDQLVELSRRERQRPLRVLSCGCSGGEEPYSVLISLLEAGIPLQQLEVEAIDISAVALARAAEGLYSSHSLRGMDPRRLARFFDPEGRRWRLRPEFREVVRFHRGTLQDRLATLTPGWNAVFCRNVMLYLHDQARQELLMAIAERLAPGGLLLVAAAESALVPSERYRRLEGGHGAGFVPLESRASLEGAATSRSGAPPPLREGSFPPGQAVRRPAATPAAAASVDFTTASSSPPPQSRLPRRATVGTPITRAPQPDTSSAHSPSLEPAVHLEVARQHRQQGQSEAALEALRRCLYLDPANREALLLRADLARELGRHQEADQLRRRLARATVREQR